MKNSFSLKKKKRGFYNFNDIWLFEKLCWNTKAIFSFLCFMHEFQRLYLHANVILTFISPV